MHTHLLTLPVAGSRDATFNFLADIENLPAWTGGFCEWLELKRDGWRAYTSLGELDVETKVDDIAGEIDLRLRPVSGPVIVIPLRVRSDGGEDSLVSVACRQPAGLEDEHYERLFESLLAGLRDLSGRRRTEEVLN